MVVDPLAILIAGVVATGLGIAVAIPYADKVSKEYNARLSEAFKRDDEYELDGKLKLFETVVHKYISKHQGDYTFKDKFLNALVGNDLSIIQEIKNRCEETVKSFMAGVSSSRKTKTRRAIEWFINRDGYFIYIRELIKEEKLHPNIEAAEKFLRDAGALKG